MRFNKKYCIKFIILYAAVLTILILVRDLPFLSDHDSHHETEKLKIQENDNLANKKRDSYSILKTYNDSQSFVDTALSDLFITVKTTRNNHRDRVQLLIDTWWIFVKDQTYFFTDEFDQEFHDKTNGHFINTNCSSSHSREALCCKTSMEFDYFYLSNKKWWCHVDDDTYLNVAALLELLRQYNPSQSWYIGRPSLNRPIEARKQNVKFWFATGGAGFCISRPLAEKMLPLTGGGRLKTQCGEIRLPDDCTIGYIIRVIGSNLTINRNFHSHLEGLRVLRQKDLNNVISLSYSYNKVMETMNIVSVDGFLQTEDPTRFRSVHCHLYPHLKECPPAIFQTGR